MDFCLAAPFAEILLWGVWGAVDGFDSETSPLGSWREAELRGWLHAQRPPSPPRPHGGSLVEEDPPPGQVSLWEGTCHIRISASWDLWDPLYQHRHVERGPCSGVLHTWALLFAPASPGCPSHFPTWEPLPPWLLPQHQHPLCLPGLRLQGGLESDPITASSINLFGPPWIPPL